MKAKKTKARTTKKIDSKRAAGRVATKSNAGSSWNVKSSSASYHRAGEGQGKTKTAKASISAETLDRRFDDGEDVTQHLDVGNARRPAREQRRVNVDFPLWMIESLDREARRLGVTRQSIIKVWLAERLERERATE